jgi:hypothetical protein
MREGTCDRAGIAIAKWGSMQPNLASLRDVLADLYPTREQQVMAVETAGIVARKVAFSSVALVSWHGILTEAGNQGRLKALFAVVIGDYPANQILRRAIEVAHRAPARPVANEHVLDGNDDRTVLLLIAFKGLFMDSPPGLVDELVRIHSMVAEALDIINKATLLLREVFPDEPALTAGFVVTTTGLTAWSSIVKQAPLRSARAFAAVLLCALHNTAVAMPETRLTLARLIAANDGTKG